MTDTTTAPTSYTCPYCRMESAGAASSCPNCGAPVDLRLRTTDSGWTELPPVADMARIQLGQSSAQITGGLVPRADVTLAAGDKVYFPHPSLLWQEPEVRLTNMSLRREWTRHRAGLPLAMVEAEGPGRLGFSSNRPGEMLAVPIQAGAAVDVQENHMVLATSGVDYDWYPSEIWFNAREQSAADQTAAGSILSIAGDVGGLMGDRGDRRSNEVITHYPMGQYIDRFFARERPGAVLVQVGGNAFQRTLAEGESIMVKPPSMLFKDPTVALQLHVEFPNAGPKLVNLFKSWTNRYLWLRLWGPGRVALQSSYDAWADPGTDFRETCRYTQHIW